MSGFRRYVDNNQPRDLFDISEFEFVDSNLSPLVQVADFLSGSLARHYDTTLSAPGSIELLKIIKPRMPVIDEWPPTYNNTIRALDNKYSEYDLTIAECACRATHKFIEQKKSYSDSLVRDQVDCMRILLFHFTISPESYLSARQIIKYLCAYRNKKMNLKHFQLKIIAKLRDQNMLITGGEKGYKLPTSVEDCYQWLDRGLKTIEPLRRRISLLRQSIRIATKGDLDILDESRYKNLREFLDG